jgi:predicted nucleic acid-binding Zn ribbon protein
MNVKFRSQRKRRGRRPVILYLAVLALVIYMYLALSGVIR